MKKKNLKIFALALSGVLSATQLTGCGTPPIYNEEKGCEFTREFGIGEHVLSVPLGDTVPNGIMQIESHPGYEVVGVSISAYGEYSSHYGGGVVVYANSEEVECSSNLYDNNGNFVYLDFGVPVNYDNETEVSKEDEFAPGQHVILVPIEDNIMQDNYQYQCHEGYEVVGITVSAYGEYSSHYGGGAVMYKNSVTVKCQKGENGYTSFGIPVVKEQVKGLK